MFPPGRGAYSFSNRGRGRGRNNKIISQMGNKKLIAQNIASSSNTGESSIQDPEYEEFLAFKAAKNKGDNKSSYANITVAEESEEGFYEQNPNKEVILLLEDKDLRWKDQPWTLMERYMDTGSYPMESYKSRQYYEYILSSTESGEIFHYMGKSTRAGNNQNYNFSKIIIKQIISVEQWGTSPLKDKEMAHPETKAIIKFNYYDYINAFYKAFLYENQNKKHSWFFRICPEVYNSEIPNWFYKWWISYGPSTKILPDILMNYFIDWAEVSPTLIEARHDNKLIEGMSSLHYFTQFGIPWIWKWSPEVSYTTQQIPCLRRVFFTKFWKKMMNKEDGILNCQETIEKIENTIDLYSKQVKLKSQRESPSPFQQIVGKYKMMGTPMSEEEMLTKYFEEIKKDLIKNLKNKQVENMSISTNEEEEDCLAGESQNPEDEDEDEDDDHEDFINAMIGNLQSTIQQNKMADQNKK